MLDQEVPLQFIRQVILVRQDSRRTLAIGRGRIDDGRTAEVLRESIVPIKRRSRSGVRRGRTMPLLSIRMRADPNPG